MNIHSYEEARNYIEKKTAKGSVYGLDTMNRLLDFLNRPDKQLNIVHIAGTNGKGSVQAFLSSILRKAGYQVGIYSSPSVFSYRERIRTGKGNEEIPIGRQDFVQCLQQCRDAEKEMAAQGFAEPTAFELETALALLYFLKQGCDIVLLETGLGGAMDATTAVSHILCAGIASVSMDHMALLGDTVEEIAAQKAGILKEGAPVVVMRQQPAVEEVFRNRAKELGIPMIVTDKCITVSRSLHGQKFTYGTYEDLYMHMLGEHQQDNCATAIEIIKVLQQAGFSVTTTQLRQGIAQMEWPGRFQVLQEEPLVILDGAHNADAARVLAKAVKEYLPDKQLRVVMGIFKDKEYEKIAGIIAPLAKEIITVTPPGERGLLAEELAKVIEKLGFSGKTQAAASLQEGIKECVFELKQEEALLICGSLSFLGEAKHILEQSFGEIRINRIYKNTKFQELLQQIEQLELSRKFCLHGFEHLLDTARIAYILALEGKTDFTKEEIYAAALLHDIGRGEQYLHGTPHEDAGVQFAEEILKESGFSEQERELIKSAIHVHRGQTENDKAGGRPGELAKLLQRADNLTRQCYRCKAYEECYWNEDRKNHGILL